MGMKALWDDYGIIDGIMVCKLFFLQANPWLSVPIAIYPWISTCRHSRTTLARFITSNYQRNIQRPSRYVGYCIYWRRKHTCRSKTNSRRHWSQVSPESFVETKL
jgi:hypothetical protein